MFDDMKIKMKKVFLAVSIGSALFVLWLMKNEGFSSTRRVATLTTAGKTSDTAPYLMECYKIKVFCNFIRIFAYEEASNMKVTA